MRYAYTDEKKQHLHTLDGKALMGTSTVAKVIGKGDALTWWSSGMAVAEFGWLNPKKESPERVQEALREGFERISTLDLDGYGKLLTKAYRAFYDNRSKSQKTGVDMHAELENYVKHCLSVENGKPILVLEGHEAVISFSKWAVQNVDIFLFSEMHTYSEFLWLGGIADCGARMKDGKNVVIDFKSSKDAYADQFIQCALYDLQIGENGGFDAEGNDIFDPMVFDGYLIVPFGAEDVTPRPFWDAKTARESAMACLTVYKFCQLFEIK